MTKLHVTEAGTVQFPMVLHVAEVGRTPLPPRVALAIRGGQKFDRRGRAYLYTDLRSEIER